MEAINDFEGAVILVSHDRFLIEACADRLWLVGGGTVRRSTATWTITAGSCSPARLDGADRPAGTTGAPRARARTTAGPPPSAASRSPPCASGRRWSRRAWRKLSEAIAKIDAALADGSAFERDAAKAADLARKRAEAAAALGAAEEEWLRLGGEIELAAA